MHKEWVTVEGGYTGVVKSKPYRYIEEYHGDGSDGYNPLEIRYEQKIDVPDLSDEPLVDGVYLDKEGDRWLRLNGKWIASDDGLYSFVPWDEAWGTSYGPFELLPVEDY